MSTPKIINLFDSPVTQSILPVARVVEGQPRRGGPTVNVTIVGFYPIASTEFVGSETSFSLASGNVRLAAIELPYQPGNSRVSQYMVAAFDAAESYRENWLGHSSFVPAHATGNFARWILPVSVITHEKVDGILIGGLSRNLDVTYTPPPAPTPPSVDDATIRWAAQVALDGVGPCAAFDFNWIDLFQAKLPSGVDFLKTTNLTITPTVQPAGLPMKSSVLQHQLIGANGQPVFNTVRVLVLKPSIEAGDYVFEFLIGYTDEYGKQATAPAELTLTVVK